MTGRGRARTGVIGPLERRVGGVASLLVALTVVAGVAAPAGASGVTVTRSAIPLALTPTTTGGLRQVACASTDLCVGIENAEAAVYDGSTWTSDNPPLPSSSQNANLVSVSCSSTTLTCVAVGGIQIADASLTYQFQAWIETYANGAWTSQILPGPIGTTDNWFTSVTCAATCVATGYVSDGTFETLVDVVAVQDGSSWNATPLAGTVALPGSGSYTTTCVSSTWCVAVKSDADTLYVDTYDGSTWTPSQWSPPSSVTTLLGGDPQLSCSGPDECMVTFPIGQSVTDATLADGVWTFGQFAGAYAGSGLSCAPGPDLTCLSIGLYSGGVAPVDVAALYRDGAWTAVANPAAQEQISLWGVSCVSTTWCVAVGTVAGLHGLAESGLAADFDGQGWQRLQLFGTPPSAEGQATAVSCTSASSCTAVGLDETDETAVAATSGTSGWTVSNEAPPPGTRPLYATGVSCVGATCVDVGWQLHSVDGGESVWYLPVVETSVNRGSWTVDRVPLPFDGYQRQRYLSGSLSAVSCISSQHCVAVGTTAFDPTSVNETALVTTESGGKWTSIVLHAAGTFDDTLTSVSCSSPLACVAVGQADTYVRAGGARTVEAHGLAAMLRGHVWTVTLTSAPAGDTHGDALSSVSCATARWCVAVGEPAQSTGRSSALQWNGRQWSSPVPLTTTASGFSSVSCPAVGACVAIGWRDDAGSSVPHPAIVSLSARKWSVTSLTGPINPYVMDTPYSVSCWAPSQCLVVGPGDYLGGTGYLAVTYSIT